MCENKYNTCAKEPRFLGVRFVFDKGMQYYPIHFVYIYLSLLVNIYTRKIQRNKKIAFSSYANDLRFLRVDM